jgi:Flp pilus assembly protein TadG
MNRRGSTAVEFAVVLPVLLMFVLGLIDFGRLLWSNATLAHAVAEASRCGAVNTSVCGTTALIQSYAAAQAWGLALTSAAFTVTTPTCGVQVNGTMTFTFFIPWLYGSAPFGAANTLTLNALACNPT